MARQFRFLVTMEVLDDDQTDPVEVALVLNEVLNCGPGANAEWKEAYDDMLPECRPQFKVLAVEES